MQFKGEYFGKGNFKRHFGNVFAIFDKSQVGNIYTNSHTCSWVLFPLPRIPKDFQLTECLSLLNAFWDKCRKQCFQNSTCENKLTAERKQGFARKFTRFQHFTHFVTDCSSHFWPPQIVFQQCLFPKFLCKVSKQDFPLYWPGAFLLKAQQPLNVTCHLLMLRPFATVPKSNRIWVNKWCAGFFHQFYSWTKS